MPGEGFTLRGVLADGARPFRHRAGVRELLGVPEDLDVRVAVASMPPGVGFAYARLAAWVPEGPAAGPSVVTEVVFPDAAVEPGWLPARSWLPRRLGSCRGGRRLLPPSPMPGRRQRPGRPAPR